jgi:hypothetical protein
VTACRNGLTDFANVALDQELRVLLYLDYCALVVRRLFNDLCDFWFGNRANNPLLIVIFVSPRHNVRWYGCARRFFLLYNFWGLDGPW